MHILFVCNEYPPCPHGGIGVFTKKLAEAFVLKGYKASVIGYDETIRSTQTKVENGVLVRRLPKHRSTVKLTLGKYTLSFEPISSRKNLSKNLDAFIKEIKPDLVESYDWGGPLYKKPGIPLIVRMHGANTAHAFAQSKPVSSILSYFERRNIKFATSLIAVSDYIGMLTLNSLKLSRLSFKTIYNAVDTNEFHPNNAIVKNRSKLLFVGRIHPLKGLNELIRCCNILFQQNPSLTLDIIGDGNDHYKQELESIIDDTIKHRIRFIGRVPHHELAKYYNEAAILFMPSQSEAFGLTAIEAMACRTAVAITNKASGPEIVTDRVNGLLIDFNDSEIAAKTINDLLSDQNLIEDLATAGLKHIKENFTLHKIIEQNIATYKQVLNDL
jgi:glycosyltransferase involved in cell wall biosynthesis